MYVSVVICTYSLDNYRNLTEAVDSLRCQTYPGIEMIVVFDGNRELYKKFISDYACAGALKTILLEQNVGVSEARNAGIRVAAGDVIAFMDDDALAENNWIEKLLSAYESHQAISVGGSIKPIWSGGRPDYFCEELYWLVGVTQDNFMGNKITEVRNTYGPNMSFKKVVFDRIGLFNKDLGFAKSGKVYIQGEEAELSLRMQREFGRGVTYNPSAIVHHKVAPSKLKVKKLLKRAFAQGISKYLLRRLQGSPGSLSDEKSYLRDMLLHAIPRRLKKAYRISEIKKITLLVAVITSVGLGYVYGSIRNNSLRLSPGPDVRI